MPMDVELCGHEDPPLRNVGVICIYTLEFSYQFAGMLIYNPRALDGPCCRPRKRSLVSLDMGVERVEGLDIPRYAYDMMP